MSRRGVLLGVAVLGFQGRYVEPILAGVKCRTVRRPSSRLPVVGERVALRCRYDLPPFAFATVTYVGWFRREDLLSDPAAYGHVSGRSGLLAVQELYGLRARLVDIRFRLVS